MRVKQAFYLNLNLNLYHKKDIMQNVPQGAYSHIQKPEGLQSKKMSINEIGLRKIGLRNSLLYSL